MERHQRAAPPPGASADEFVMSDASVDRMGDVIEQSGWQLQNFAPNRNPIALFNHDKNQVIGTWRDVAVKNGKLIGRLVLAEPGTSPLVDAVRSLVRQNISACRVGRLPTVASRAAKARRNNSARLTASKKAELLECSLVSVPANPNALAIAKELPRDVLRKIFRKPATENFDKSDALTRKPAKPLAPARAEKMNTSTTSQRIQAAQTNLNALREGLKDLSSRDELNADETKRYEELPGEIEAQKKELEKHQRAERALIDGSDSDSSNSNGNSKPHEGEILVPGREVTPPRQTVKTDDTPPRLFAVPKKKVEPNELVIRSLACWVKSEASHERDLGKALREFYGNDEMTGIVLRTAVNPATTTVATWAAELVQTANAGFLDRLIPSSIYNQLSAMGVKLHVPARRGDVENPGARCNCTGHHRIARRKLGWRRPAQAGAPGELQHG